MIKIDSISPTDIISNINSITKLLTNEQKEELYKCISARKYKKNELIYKEGEVPQDLLCLVSGKVKIQKNGISGRNQIIRIVKVSEYFGYRAYIANQNYVTSASALETTIVYKIPLDTLYRWMQNNINLSLFFVKQLSIDLGISDHRIVSLTQKHIRGRLADAILFLIDNFGFEEDKTTLAIHLSREDLASLSNMTTSNAIRTLSAFATENLITIDGRSIKVLDKMTLQKISKNG